MGRLSEDEGSSSDSSNEFLVPADKLDFSSDFFKETTKPKKQTKPNPKKKQAKPAALARLESSDSEDDEFDDEEQLTSAKLLSQVLKNLENVNKPFLPKDEGAAKSEQANSTAPPKDDLSQEINDLLMLGESQASTSKASDAMEVDVEVKQEDNKEDVKKPADYAIPEKGVQIHLPGENFRFDKKNKKQQDLQKVLQNKINQRIRKTQVFVHKVGLLSWLAYGFHLNKLANDTDLLGITLSLVSPQNYPKDKPDLKYLEKFTKWFTGLFQMFQDHKDVVFNKELLLQRIKEKTIHNYVEMILLYVAAVRGLGMNCRLVVSLRPPRLKPKRDQLFKIPASDENDVRKVKKEKDEDDDDDDEMEDVTEQSTKTNSTKNIKKEVKAELNDNDDNKSTKAKNAKKPPAKSAKTTAAGRKRLKTKEQSVSPTKVIAENSKEAEKTAKEEAKKKAAALLQGKSANTLNNCKVVLNRSKVDSNIKKAGKTMPMKNANKNESDDESHNKTKNNASEKVAKNTQKNLKKPKGDKEDEEMNEKESTSNRSTRGRRNILANSSKKAVNDKNEDSDDGKNEDDQKKTIPKKGRKVNQNNKRTNTREQNRTGKKNKDDNDDTDDEKDVKEDMPLARKLSLRLKQKTETKKTTTSTSSKDKSKATGTSKKRKHPLDEEMSEFEEEFDTSSEFSPDDDDDDDDDQFSSDYEYEELKPQKRRSATVQAVKRKPSTSSNKAKLDKSIISKFAYKSNNPRKLISSEDESSETDKLGYNVWVEVYIESEESWISVSVLDQKIHCVSHIFKKANHPVLYIIAWNSENTLKDVTRRYCPHWLTDTRKKRVEEKWWNETLSIWKEKQSAMSKAEDEQLLHRELEQPLPKTLSECRGHPLYVLQRHLLKFEALYPPDCVPLGHLKTGEAIYSRHCVHTLRSRETWSKEARVVKPAQEAYKIVKAMPKYDKLSGQKIKDQPLELFGKWQTNPYEPPEAKDGKVPRNEYGNVDLFKMCMLPKGCVHIDLPALNRVARKLNIDCAPACTGFNFGCRGALPAFQGYVVCEEYEDTLCEAWEEEQVLAQKRAREKREKKVYGNWKKLIRGLLIREKLAAKYSFGNEEENADENDGDEEEEEEEEVKASTKRKKPAAKKSTAAVASTRKAKGKRSQPKQEPGNPRKKLKK